MLAERGAGAADSVEGPCRRARLWTRARAAERSLHRVQACTPTSCTSLHTYIVYKPAHLHRVQACTPSSCTSLHRVPAERSPGAGGGGGAVGAPVAARHSPAGAPPPGHVPRPAVMGILGAGLYRADRRALCASRTSPP